MPKLDAKALSTDPFTTAYFTPIVDAWWRQSRILIVLDGNLSIKAANNFGISRAIAHIRDFSAGFASFEVTLATRDGPSRTIAAAGPEEYTYEGFRFDQKDGGANGAYSLHKYDQLWLFGYLPGNGPENNPDGLNPVFDKVPDLAKFNPTSQSELKVLAQWMDAGGGVFAAGDHHRLGASMCKGIPRVRTMRRWLVRDGVPTQSGPTRYDTQQPPDFDEIDSTPQPIRWVPMMESHEGPLAQHAPHPILCHPQHGPIDVLPDHMHEGRCHHPQDFLWQVEYGHTIDKFGDYEIEHYPRVRGNRPLPQAIAFGSTLPVDIYGEGMQPFRETPLIVAYDGQQVSRGRVVVDSTWHHWFDMNLTEFDGPESQVVRDKIYRYFANVAIWLAAPSWRTSSIVGEIKREQFRYFGREQFSVHLDSVRLGSIARAFFAPRVGHCWVWKLADEFYAEAGMRFERAGSGLWPHLKGSPRNYFCSMFLGELVKLVYADQPETDRQIAQNRCIKPTRIAAEDPLQLAREAARRACAAIGKAWREDIEHGEKLLEQFEAAGKTRTTRAVSKPAKRTRRRAK